MAKIFDRLMLFFISQLLSPVGPLLRDDPTYSFCIGESR
jgi:hypothetical protein